MTRQRLIELLQCALRCAQCGDDELLERCLIELCDQCTHVERVT